MPQVGRMDMMMGSIGWGGVGKGGWTIDGEGPETRGLVLWLGAAR